MSFPVVEKFVSINGESICAGEPAVFIRFRGCDLNCSYCDTKWANNISAPAEMLSAKDISSYVESTGITDVTLTGGEPLLQKDIKTLIEMLVSNGHRVEIETNGAHPIDVLAASECRPVFTLDYKLPSSGMERFMLTDNYKYLDTNDAVKFVSGDINDLEAARTVIERYRLTEKCKVYISPVFGKIEPEQIVDYLIDNKMNGVRLQLQLHKYIWDPDRRGV
ncbi:MAG: putative 7-carboxy-7-deazaguanine synthase QueE [Ruminococcus sp.]|nr:putative 7-carboxy-7-deazaguanine synthase QueE [Ruminococcus sp.]